MSAVYFLSRSEENQTLGIEPETLINKLRETWPSARVAENADYPYVATWELSTDEGELVGGVYTDARAVTIEGPFPACARFAIWCRRQVGSENDLLFYDEGFEVCTTLTRDTTPEQIQGVFSGYE